MSVAAQAPPTSHVELPMNAPEQSNLKLVLDWWRIVIENGHLEYVPTYQAESYIQHNPLISTGRKAFIKAFSEDNHPVDPIPEKLSSNIPLAGARGDFVWIMRETDLPDKKVAGRPVYRNGFDILRVDHGQIQEHWDVARRKAGADVVIYGASVKPLSSYDAGKLTPQERANRDIAVEAAEAVYIKHDVSAMKRLFAPDYQEHFWKLGDPQTLQADLVASESGKDLLQGHPELTIVNGEYVLMMWAARSADPDHPEQTYPWFAYQLMRVSGGKVVEHWQSS